MSGEWKQTTAAEVKVGERVRIPTGQELLVSRIESPFLGMAGMLALIEDSPQQWFKQPLPVESPVEVESGS